MYGCNKLYCEHLGRYFARHYRQLAAASAAASTSGPPLPRADLRLHRAERGHERLRARDDPCRRPGRPYSCFVRADTRIPFMAMPDAVEALLALMDAPARSLTTAVYNVAAFSLSAGELAPVSAAFPAARSHSRPMPAARPSSTPGRRTSTTRRPPRLGLRPAYDLERAFNDYLVPNITRHVPGLSGAPAARRRRGDAACTVRSGRGCRPSSRRSARRALEARARHPGPAGRADHRGRPRGPELLRQQLPRAGQPPRARRAAQDGLARWGFGLASVRFICGTQDLHKELEAAIARFLGTRTRSSTPRASTPTAACSRRCSARRTPSSPTRSTTPRSSTASGSARPGAHRYAHGDLDELERQLTGGRAARGRG